MMVKRNLDGTVDKSLANQEICESDAIVHNHWRLATSGAGSYGRQAGWLTKFKRGLKFLKVAIDRNIWFSALGTAFFNFDAFLVHFSVKHFYKVVV